MQRLDDGAPAHLVQEREDVGAVGRHEGLGRVAGEVERVELLVRVTEAARVVQDDRAASGALEQLRHVHVLGVERRVLPDEHGLDLRESHVEGGTQGIVGRRVADGQGANTRVDVPFLDEQVPRQGVK